MKMNAKNEQGCRWKKGKKLKVRMGEKTTEGKLMKA
jgi:hypothetical protein